MQSGIAPNEGLYLIFQSCHGFQAVLEIQPFSIDWAISTFDAKINFLQDLANSGLNADCQATDRSSACQPGRGHRLKLVNAD